MGVQVRRVVGAVVGLVVAAGILMAAFLGPGHADELHGVRLGAVGPPAGVAQLAAGLARARPGAFRVHPAPSEAAAVAALRHRRLDAVVVLGPPGAPLRLDTASAASTTLAAATTSAIRAAATATGRQLTTRDVVAPAPGDPHATAPFFVVLPLTIIGLLAAVVLTLVLRLPLGPLLAALAGVAVGGGVAAAVVADVALGALGGHAWTLAWTGALVTAASATVACGLRRLLGVAGLGLAALVLVVLGSTSSGGATAPAMLPAGWRQIGPWLPPGAGVELVRDATYFGGDGGGRPLAVLAAWAAGGLALCALGRATARARRAPAVDVAPAGG